MLPCKQSSLFLISKTAVVDSDTSLQGSDRPIIPVSEVYDVLNKIHGILDEIVSKGF